MKQIRFKHLVTLGLCCSLLVNSITGITAIAETVTIESSPTVESTQESTTSSEEIKENEKEETTEVDTELSETNELPKVEIDRGQTEATEIAQESNLNEQVTTHSKIMPRVFVWAATGTTNKTTVYLNDVVDYRLKFENITTDDTNSDILGPIRID